MTDRLAFHATGADCVRLYRLLAAFAHGDATAAVAVVSDTGLDGNDDASRLIATLAYHLTETMIDAGHDPAGLADRALLHYYATNDG